jgi:TP901 family phage tail tape measure protein
MKYEMILDFLINAKTNPESLRNAQKTIEQALSAAAPKLNLDDKQIKQVMGDFNKLLNMTEVELGDLKKSLAGMELSDNLQKDFQNLIKEFENVDNINFDSLNKAIDDLNFDELGKIFTDLEKVAESTNFEDQIKGMAKAYTEAETKVRQQLDTQKKALKQMELTGQTGTESYKRLKNEIAGAEKELKNLGGSAGETKSVMDKMATFGLAAQGIQQVADSLGMFTSDYIGLDTATQKIKTLGGTAKELAPNFREMAIEMSKNLPIASTEIANATYEALSAGINASEKDISAFMEASSKLAVGGAESVGNSVNVLSSLINAYGLKATDATKVSDELFTTINLGKTNLPELSASLSQVIPTAAGLGVEFKNVGASLALMTANGIPTAQATTKLNALFVEMQKPGAELTKTLSAAGVSVDSLKKQISSGDFYGALDSMKGAFDKAGVSATQAFSSVESGAAFQTLTKDMGKLRGTIDSFANSAGATESAYGDMSDGIENKMQSLKNAISNIFIGINDVFGSGFATTVGAAQQLAPIMITLQGLGSIVPAGTGKKITEMATAIVSKLVPGLIMQTAATEGAEAAQTRLNLKVLMNPYVLAVAGIVALVASLHFLSDALHETAAERAEEVKGEQAAVDSQIQLAEKQAQITKSKAGLIDSFKNEGEAAMNNADLLLKLSQAYPGVIDKTKSYSENLEKLKGAGDTTHKELDKLGNELIKLDAQKLELDYKVAKVNVEVDKEGIEDSLTDAFGTWGLTDATEWLFGTSGARADAEAMIKPFTDAIYKASDSEELNKAALDMQMAIWNNPEFAELDDKQKQIAVEKVQKMADSQSKVIQANNEKMAKQSTLLSSQVKQGLISESQAVEHLKKQYGLSDTEAKKLLNTQEDNTAEAHKLLKNVEDITGSFEKAKTAATGIVAGATSKATDYALQIKNIQKMISDPSYRPEGVSQSELEKQLQDYKKLYDAEIKQGKLEQQNVKTLEKIEAQVKNAIDPQVKEKQEKDYLAELQKQVSEKEKAAAQDKILFDIAQKQTILGEKRSRNEYDDFLLNQKNLELLNTQNKEFLEILEQQGIEVEKIDGKTELKFNKKMSSTQKENVSNYVKDYLLNIQNEMQTTEIAGKEITLNAQFELQEEQAKLDEQIRKTEFEKIKIQIELGTANIEDVEPIVKYYADLREQAKIEADKLNKELEDLDAETKSKIAFANGNEVLIATITTAYAHQKTALLKNISEQTTIIENNQNEIDSIYKDSFAVRNKMIDEWYAKENEALDNEIGIMKTNRDLVKSFNTDGADQKTYDDKIANLDNLKDKELSNIVYLDKMKILSTKDIEQRKLDIEEEFQAKRLEAEKEFQGRKRIIELIGNGQDLEIERKSGEAKARLDVENTEQQIQVLKDMRAKLGDAFSIEDTKQLAELEKTLIKNQTILEEKGGYLNLAAEELGKSINESLTNMFAGDSEAAGNSLKKFFLVISGVMVQGLTDYLNKVILEWFLKAIAFSPADPLTKLLIAPVLYGLISASVKAIAMPLLKPLSFSSGGVIDSNSLIQVGDASILGGENKEWIFRNDQLKTLVASIVQASNYSLSSKLDNLTNILATQNLETRIKGEDIYLSMKRTQYNNKLRSY